MAYKANEIIVFTTLIWLNAYNIGVYSIEPTMNYRQRVLNGYRAKSGQFPWQVLLTLKGRDDGTSTCTGSLIREDFILTAAHCVVHKTSCEGQMGAIKKDSDRAVILKSKKLYPHPCYIHNKDPTLRYDVGLIELAECVELSRRVNLIRLPLDKDKNNLFVHYSNVTVLGWGRKQRGESSDYLLYANMVVQDNTECILNFQSVFFDSFHMMMCAVSNKNQMICPGDSGGPLFYRDANDVVIQIGISSFSNFECENPNVPQAFVRVSVHTDWIQNIFYKKTHAKNVKCRKLQHPDGTGDDYDDPEGAGHNCSLCFSFKWNILTLFVIKCIVNVELWAT